MSKPNLFIVGAPKCGTTSWVEYLSQHHDIFFSPAKEPHYFSTDFPRFTWAQSLEEYESNFVGSEPHKIVGEASVMYLYSSNAAKEIKAYSPDAKILVFLRPVSSFLRSYHQQLLYNRDETIQEFELAWSLWAERSVGRKVPPTCRDVAFLNYRAVASFGEQLDRYFQVFDKEKIKVVWFEDWIGSPRKTYLDILKFLGINDDGRQEFRRLNSARRHRSAWIANLTQRPSPHILRAARFASNLFGLERGKLAAKVRAVNSVERKNNDLPEQVKLELRDFLREDTKILRALTNRDYSADDECRI